MQPIEHQRQRMGSNSTLSTLQEQEQEQAVVQTIVCTGCKASERGVLWPYLLREEEEREQEWIRQPLLDIESESESGRGLQLVLWSALLLLLEPQHTEQEEEREPKVLGLTFPISAPWRSRLESYRAIWLV